MTNFFPNTGRFAVLTILSVLSGFVPPALAATINVTTDRNPVSIDESFHIVFSANETPDDDPDFSPLEQDFDILSQSSSSSSSWINGKSSKTVQWTLTVMAKQTGDLTIPPVKFGNDISQSDTILVTQGAANNNASAGEDLFLDVEATPANPYVQSQVLYTLKLYTRIEIAQARLTEPELADAVIEKLGDDSNYNTRVNGVNYSVTERKYAVFPQKSGRMTIKPLVLTADVLTGSRPGFNGFFSPQITKTKRVQSKEINLDVKPAPAAYTGQYWLSAEELHLKQEWSGDTGQMKVGEPLTRTLTLLAKGATAGQLPELNRTKIGDQVKIYPDQPVLQEQKKPEGIIAFREEKIALIPSKPGTFKLPALEIPWFNTKSQKMEIARIPETTISAVANQGAATSTVSAAPASKKESTEKTSTAQFRRQQSNNIWPWISLALAFGWLASSIYFFTRRPATPQLKTISPEGALENSLKASITSLKKACQENDAVAAKDSLIEWGRKKYDVYSLGAIAAFCDARLRDEIYQLNRILYDKNKTQWQGKTLLQAFSENKAREKITRNADSGLAPLYRL